MHPVRHEDDVEPGRRIDPNRRAGEPRVPEGTDGQQFTPIGRERRIDIPAEASGIALQIRRRRTRHLLHRERREQAPAVVHAAGEQRLREDREVRGGPE